MDFESQIIFFFSALGAFNGILLSIYFAITAKRKKFSNYFLALLLLVLSIRITKSIFLYFNPELANIFIQIGLSACILIGPSLFLYLKTNSTKKPVNYTIHTLPYLVMMSLLGIFYQYADHKGGWSFWIVNGIYLQWFIYIALSFKFITPVLTRIKDNKKLKNIDIWILSIYIGVAVIWLAYNIGIYTSYLIGALSFSFVLYLIILLFIFKNNRQTTFFEEKEKYSNKNIEGDVSDKIKVGLSNFVNKELFLDSKITLDKMATELNVPKHTLSQYLNEKLEQSFSTFINDLRIEKAKEYICTEANLSIEGIAYESGFNSKSTFYTAFKKKTGITPIQFRDQKTG